LLATRLTATLGLHMDSLGAQSLRARIEQQEHWRQAAAVIRGAQSATDPDAGDVEDIGDGVRLYATREEQRQEIDGRPTLVVRRLTKRIVDGRWETFYDVERARPLDPWSLNG